MRGNENPVQIDPQAYVDTLEEELQRVQAENLQLRAAVRFLQGELQRLQPPPRHEGVEGQHPDASSDGE